MSEKQEERYVDPNSGAAPQPGGYAGPEGVELGHGTPMGAQRDEEEAADGPDFTESEMVDMKAVETEAINPSDDEGGEGLEQDQRDPEANEPAEGEDDEDGDESYDPGAHSVEEVKAYLNEHPDEEGAVLAAERAGKARKGLVGE